MINVFCKLGKINEALEFLEDRCVYETSPQNALLEGCCRTGKFSFAKGRLEKMYERNIANCDSWNILIRWLCKNVRIRKAFELLGKMIVSSCILECATCLALVIGNCRLNKYGDALKLFYEIRANCWVLDAISYSELVEGLCQVERTLEATEVFCYMSSNRCSLYSSPLICLSIKSVCAGGKVDEAVNLLQLAYYSGTWCSNATMYTTIMLKLSELGKAKDLLVVLSQMLIEGCSLDLEVYSILIQSMRSQNQIKDCVFPFNMMVNEGLVPDSERLFDLLSCIANHSQLYKVLSLINKLICNSEILNPAIYNMLINGFWKEGNKHEACHLLDLMWEKGWVPDSSTHGLLIGSVAREEGDMGHLPIGILPHKMLLVTY
jgi:pentatricopeptide repeat protein